VNVRRLWLGAGCAMVGAIIWLSVTPSPPEIEVTQGDKLGHVVAYAVLMFWFCQLHAAARARLRYALAFLALGIGLEFVQGALGYRNYEQWDMVADAGGIGVGWMAAMLLKPGILERFERR
jgi:hypothetical protein